ncbi:alkaline phosphatase family protein [Streptomyces sp. SCSIO 30461]|uniref:alkaline phosphatase family protein n=1 Tax=Streptomyces sp. SCSIO 30461 TaxID=3118085 RepID=UPI0030CDD74A
MRPVLPFTRTRRFTTMAWVAAVLVGATAVAAPAPRADAAVSSAALPATDTGRVLVIGLDGANLDRIKAADAPNLHSLMSQGMTAPSTLPTVPMALTSSGPGWSTVATGVWPDKHKVWGNLFLIADFDTHPDFLTRIERSRPDLATYAAAGWEPLASSRKGGPVFSSAVDKRLSLDGSANGNRTEDGKVAVAAAEELHRGDPDAAFVYFGEIDSAGHGHGAATTQYLDAIARTDRNVGMLLGAVTTRPNYSEENWQILVTTDHGHTDKGGHGGFTLKERGTFVIATGPGIPPGSVRHDVRQVDVAATALSHVGVAADGLDGRPLGTADWDAFDTVRPLLRTRVDDRGVPAGTLGFTHTPPDGWRVDNSAMAGGGVAEWRGWTFTTDEFWSQTQWGQYRETNVRSRDVFAVADSDEWADRSTEGSFDSTLISPSWATTGGAALTLSYRSHYRHWPGQRAEVRVSFDGGPWTTVRSHTRTALASGESMHIDVPTSATDIRVGFRYRGSNDWYWAVDDVRVGPAR